MAQVMKKPSHQFGLTELGEQQADATARYIEKRFGADSFDGYFTSTYVRARETFARIFKDKEKDGQQIHPIIDARINEITRGYASLMSEEQLRERYGQETITLELNGWFHNIPLCGQSCVQIDHIIQSFLAFLREACADKRVIIVGHGTWINLCCRILTNRTIEHSEALHHAAFYKNASVTVFAKDKSGNLILEDENIAPIELEK